jgi:hypothetical protein
VHHLAATPSDHHPAAPTSTRSAPADPCRTGHDTWKHTYRARAGIEGTIHQTVAVTGIRKARYTGHPKVELEHAFAATAINLIRLNAWWTHLGRLNPTLAA